jgi:predicted small metal-binding protein
MKRLACGDLVPGCGTIFTGATEERIVAAVRRHASEAHGRATRSGAPDRLGVRSG